MPGVGPDPTQRGFNISNFKSVIGPRGLLRNHDYLAIIPYPAGMLRNGPLIYTEMNLEFHCEFFSFPSTGVENYPVQRYSYGAIEMKPTIPKFTPIQCRFYCDPDSNVQRFFHEWVKTAVNFDFGDGSIVTPTAASGATPYEISYKPDYAVDIHLQIYDPTGLLVKEIRFREAYPLEVGDVIFNWGRQNENVSIPVVFTFMDWSDVTMTAPTA